MLRSFIPLFAMTFVICLFIVLMQFVWRYIDEMVGKGLSVDVIAELMFYAALSLVPMALPLSILLASLMTFGGLGEHFELTAMKASGISLTRVMKPLTLFIAIVAVAAFFFQNNLLPVAQTKMYTLLFSMHQKSPELDIPEGVFYDQITGYNLFVDKKDRATGVLHNMMIYDVSKGADNAAIILADSGRLSMNSDQAHLLLDLWNGEQFENLREASVQGTSTPYRRESFAFKQITIPFDANFNRMDEEGIRNQYVGKDIARLQATIDSVGHRIDSIGGVYSAELASAPRVGISANHQVQTDSGYVSMPYGDVAINTPINVDSLFGVGSSHARAQLLSSALARARNVRQDYEFRSMMVIEEMKNVRRHGIELHKKFTLSFACLIFFFIGAPLGAIIRKGGLGTPLVLSVLLFIFYFIIDNSGNKMARDGRVDVWEGMWLSSFVLLPLGIFFTWKAVNDSAVFNKDTYVNAIRRILCLPERRSVQLKEVVIDDISDAQAAVILRRLADEMRRWLSDASQSANIKSMLKGYADHWFKGRDIANISALSIQEEQSVREMSNTRNKHLIALLDAMAPLREAWVLEPTPRVWMGYAAGIILPVGIVIYVWSLVILRRLRRQTANSLELIEQFLEKQ